jgi:hypothetical protein
MHAADSAEGSLHGADSLRNGSLPNVEYFRIGH